MKRELIKYYIFTKLHNKDIVKILFNYYIKKSYIYYRLVLYFLDYLHFSF